jgi:hypothetical protein
VIKFVNDLWQVSVVFSTNKTNRHDIIEILLKVHVITEILFKVALSTINLNPKSVRKSEDNFIANNKNKTFT